MESLRRGQTASGQEDEHEAEGASDQAGALLPLWVSCLQLCVESNDFSHCNTWLLNDIEDMQFPHFTCLL